MRLKVEKNNKREMELDAIIHNVEMENKRAKERYSSVKAEAGKVNNFILILCNNSVHCVTFSSSNKKFNRFSICNIIFSCPRR